MKKLVGDMLKLTKVLVKQIEEHSKMIKSLSDFMKKQIEVNDLITEILASMPTENMKIEVLKDISNKNK